MVYAMPSRHDLDVESAQTWIRPGDDVCIPVSAPFVHILRMALKQSRLPVAGLALNLAYSWTQPRLNCNCRRARDIWIPATPARP